MDSEKRLNLYGSTIDFENGLNCFYNDITFEKYITKVQKNNYQLNQIDFMKMQKQSKLVKYLIQETDCFGGYYAQLMRCGDLQGT